MEAAKQDAWLKALNEYLLPGKDDANVDGLGLDSSNSDSCKDESVRGELHEMLVPAALREPWTILDNPVKLNSYYMEFSPHPNDRIYKKFGLFVKAPLPVEAERMEVDLHLARGRSVMTKLVPSGLAEFDKDEIVLAQNFQEMYLKIILDRSEFIPKSVPLGNNDIRKSSSSTFYLLLPVILHDNGSTITVDWEIVIRCLSSPVFSTSEDDMVKEHFPLDDHLQLANGCKSISDVENSLVYAQHKKEFFFITNIVHGKHGHSPCKESETSSYLEHLEQAGESKPHYKRDTLPKKQRRQSLSFPLSQTLYSDSLSHRRKTNLMIRVSPVPHRTTDTDDCFLCFARAPSLVRMSINCSNIIKKIYAY